MASWRLSFFLCFNTLALANPGEEFFEKKIRPVLAKHCLGCHNSQLKSPFGGLRLDSRAALLRGGDSGPAVLPGNPDSSILLSALTGANRKQQMPPSGKLPADLIEDFRQWIAMGAPDPRIEKAPTTAPKQSPLWSLTPPQPTPIPTVKDDRWPRNDIDRFLLAALEAKGLRPAPPVDSRTFLRRLKFDLHGLPPTPAEIREYLNDASPDADARLVDRLLASPHYGERWARHWMDLVRYAETNGHEFDNDKNDAWRYRDYLIRAFNQDLPYSQLIREHLAGDLLAQPRLSLDGAFAESPLGTGFYWFGEVLNSATDSVKARADRVDNQIDVVSKAFLGLTVSCARCHDHKFDPLPTRDYYALAGVMHNTYVREAVLDSPARAASIAAARQQIARTAPDPAIPSSRIHLRPGDQLLPPFTDTTWWRTEGQSFANHKAGHVLSSRAEGHNAFVGSLTSVKMRMPRLYMHVRLTGTQADRKIASGGDLRVTLVADDHKSQHFFSKPGEWTWQSMRMTKEIGRECFFEIVDRSRSGFLAVDAIVLSDHPLPPDTDSPPFPSTLTDPPIDIPTSTFGLISFDESSNNTRLHLRGSHENLGAEVPRGPLTAWPHTPLSITGSGRLALADWLTGDNNPLVSRVIVNRVWHHLFGQGLVRSVDNFGRMGEAPSNQALLDTLASRFAASGGSLKQLQREMVLSAAYRQGYAPHNERARQLDPRNELLWHRPPRRIDAESLRDSLLTTSGALDHTLYGPSVPPHISRFQDGRGKPSSGPLDGNNRRSLYVQVRRNFIPPLFLAFDYPLPISTIGARGASTVPSQALLLLNNEFVQLSASRWAESSASQPDRIGWLYETAFGREPTPEERTKIESFLTSGSWQDVCHVLFNSPEFVYVQ